MKDINAGSLLFLLTPIAVIIISSIICKIPMKGKKNKVSYE